MLDFNRIKEIPIADVCGRYGVKLRYRGEWGSALCPLPSHKQGETDRTFSINTQKNYWKCFSSSCNEACGQKGGDVINFVALMDGTSQIGAAKRLADLFHINEKAPEHIVREPKETTTAKATLDHNESSASVKYMQEVEGWFDATFKQGEQEPDEEYRKRVLKALKSKLIESYRSGQKSRAA